MTVTLAEGAFWSTANVLCLGFVMSTVALATPSMPSSVLAISPWRMEFSVSRSTSGEVKGPAFVRSSCPQWWTPLGIAPAFASARLAFALSASAISTAPWRSIPGLNPAVSRAETTALLSVSESPSASVT